jgi:hypothetical protein
MGYVMLPHVHKPSSTLLLVAQNKQKVFQTALAFMFKESGDTILVDWNF